MNTDGPDLRDLADVIWLARTLGGGPPPSGPRDRPAAPPDGPAAPHRTDTGRDRAAEPDHDPRDERWRSTSASPAPADATRDADNLARRTIDARVARDRPLPHPERIARALRPLRRTVVAGAGLTVDEPATAQHLANVGTMTPVFRPLRERWLELAIVVDGGSTMRLWQQTARALRSLAERRGAFRDVRTYRLDSDGGPAGLVDDGGNPHHYRELSDHAGRRLILVLTDGVGPLWRTPAAHDMLAGWARHNPIAIVQVLPPAIWHRTALPPATVVLRSAAPGRIAPAGPGRGGAPWIPVVPLRAAPLEAWARLLAGHELNGIAMPAVPVGRLPAATVTAEPAGASTPREQVVRFQSTVSPAAFALAGRLAAAPLTLPLMRAIQNVLHPESGLGHLSEILLSGLLVQLAGAGPDEDVQYEFRPGIREELLRTRSRRDAYSVLETLRDIAPFVPNPFGSLDVWALSAEPDTELGEHRQGRRFAEVAITVLGGLGGRYADMADRIRSSLSGGEPTPTRPVAGLTLDVLISYEASDQTWAEWIQRQLYGAGMRSIALSEVSAGDAVLPAAGWTVVLLSWQYAAAPQAASVWQRAAERDTAMVPLRLDAAPLYPPFTEPTSVDLGGSIPRRAYRALLDAFGLRPDDNWEDSDGPRFPHTPPEIWNVPQRNPAFAGRRETLNDLHTQFSTSTLQALHGLGGAGKTQVAIEYAHRFAAYYDLVWWIPAEQLVHSRVALVELGRVLALQEGSTADESVHLIREALRLGVPYRRWLLIFDGVDDPPSVRDFFVPDGAGHVLLTSRNPEWPQDVHTVEIGTFARAESVAFLTHRVPGLGPDDTESLSRQLGDLPLALEQAGQWLADTGTPVSQYLELLDTQSMRVLDLGPLSNYELTTATTWRMSLERLHVDHPTAAGLLEIGAFFAAEPIPLELILGSRLVERLVAYEPALSDPIRHSHLSRWIARHSLASFDSRRNTMRIHRLVREFIQDRLTAEEREGIRRDVHEALAGAKRRDPEDVSGWPTYARLLPHVRGSRAQYSADPAVRRFVIDIVHYLWLCGEFSMSQVLAEETADLWRDHPHVGEDQLTLLMDHHLGNALRHRAQFDAALQLETHALQLMREHFEDPDDLLIAGGVAANLRALGRFDEAHALSEDVYRRTLGTFGMNHRRTLAAATEVAASLRLVGQFTAAAGLDQDVFDTCRTTFDDDSLTTLLAATSYGHSLRDLGRYDESFTLLLNALTTYRTLIGDAAPATLRAAVNLAATLRKQGKVQEARDLTRDTWAYCLAVHGEGHPDTLACLMNAALEESALGNDEEARRMTRQVLDGYEVLFDEHHPYRLAALNNLLTMGPRDAWSLAQEAVDGFTMRVGPRHPYTLASRVNMANVLFDGSDVQAAWAIDEEVGRVMLDVLGPEHPDSIVAAANLATNGSNTSYEAALALGLRVLGERHPTTDAIRKQRRLGCDITPPLI